MFGRGRGNRLLLCPVTERTFQCMQLSQLSEAALYTSDLASAERFYHEVLGVEIVASYFDQIVRFGQLATHSHVKDASWVANGTRTRNSQNHNLGLYH